MPIVPTKTSGDGLSDRERDIAETMIADGLSLTEAMQQLGIPREQHGQTARRIRTKPGFQDLLVGQTKAKLGEHVAWLLSHALILARSSKSSMVQMLMTQWLLERSGMSVPDKQQSIVAGDLVLNILPPKGVGVETAGAVSAEAIVTQPALPELAGSWEEIVEREQSDG